MENSYTNKIIMRKRCKILGLLFCIATVGVIIFYRLTVDIYENKFIWNFAVEVESPNSALYGLQFLKSYGQSVTNNDLKLDKYTGKLLNWRTRFPLLNKNLVSLKNYNPQLDFNLATCAKLTTLIVDKTKNYKVGDRFQALIQAKDFYGKSKKFGGDYFRSKLIYKSSTPEKPSGIPAQIFDHSNGTYTVSALLLFGGEMHLEVLLISSIESLSNVINVTSAREYKGHHYECELESGELVECNVDLTVNDRYHKRDLCDYTVPRNLEPWFAVKPSSGVCSPIKNIVFKKSNSLNVESQFTFTSIAPIKGSGHSFFVRGNIWNPGELPRCTVKDSSMKNPTKRPNGFFLKGQWWSLECQRTLSSLSQLRSCLQSKVIYFIGDSTTRQFFSLLVAQLSMSMEGPDSSVVWQQPKIAFSSKNNITMYYRAHGPPLQNPGPPSSRPYFSDQFDRLTGGKDVYIIMDYGPHVYFYESSVYIHRMLGARDSLARLLKRYPDTQVIIKGNNVLNWSYEWLGKRQDELMVDIFKDTKSVKFIDLWDFGTVWPLETANFHPYPDPLEQQALHIFSHICPMLSS